MGSFLYVCDADAGLEVLGVYGASSLRLDEKTPVKNYASLLTVGGVYWEVASVFSSDLNHAQRVNVNFGQDAI